jgi:hypothetical protein
VMLLSSNSFLEVRFVGLAAAVVAEV